MAQCGDLATLEEIAERLELTNPSSTVEAVLDAWRLALQQRVLDLTGFSLTAGPKTDLRTNVQAGATFETKFRPVDQAVAVVARARSLGNQFAAVQADLVDPAQGKVILVGASDLTGYPISDYGIGVAAPWFRWRQVIWPVVTVNYNVLEVPEELRPMLGRAVVEWVAFTWVLKPQGGRLASFSAEKISESYQNFDLKGNSMPPVVSALLSPFVRGTATIVW